MKCDDCKNYEPKKPVWTDCYYGGDTECPPLCYLVRGTLHGSPLTHIRAAFETYVDAELFLAALPEEER